MKGIMRRLCVALATLLACALCAGGAWGAEGDYVLKGGKGYRVDKAKDRLIEMGENIRRPEDEGTFPCIQRADTDAGLISCVLVDPEFEGMEGSEGGICFFLGEDEKPAGFLPIKEDAGASMLDFSPSGEKLLISHGIEAKQDLRYYVVDAAKKSFVKEKSFTSMGPFAWIDAHRFIFVAVDEGKGLRSGTEDTWWTSPSLYDSVEDHLTVIKEAEATKNYVIAASDFEEGTLVIIEYSVKDEKDWADEDKVEEKELTVPIPAAG